MSGVGRTMVLSHAILATTTRGSKIILLLGFCTYTLDRPPVLFSVLGLQHVTFTVDSEVCRPLPAILAGIPSRRRLIISFLIKT